MVSSFGNIYESFFNNSIEGLVIFDTTGKIINANAIAADIFGYSREEVVNKQFEELIGNKYHDSLLGICNSLVEGKTVNKHGKTLIVHNYLKNEKEITIGIYLNNHISSESGPLIAAIVRDETQKWRDKHELKQSRERFEKAFHNNPVPHFILRASDRTIVNVNTRFLKLFGYNLNEVIGKEIKFLGIDSCHADGKEILPSTITNDTIHECETTAHVKTGELINVLQSYVMIKVHDEPHELWTVIDLTALKQAENHLAQLNEALEHKIKARTKDLTNMLEREKGINDLKSRFVSMASHEFRTPLTTVLVSTGLLETHIQRNDTEKCAKHIARIRSSVKLLTDILEDFLSLDKIEQGQVKPLETLIDLSVFAEKIIDDTKDTLKKGQYIDFSLTGPEMVKQDINILMSIMLNLLSNASKFSNEQAEIKWVISVQHSSMIISVSDNGIGIPDEDKPYLFSRFFRAKNAEVIPGTGLGLNIVKKYVELLRGKISFVSTENVGTTLIVEVPLLN